MVVYHIYSYHPSNRYTSHSNWQIQRGWMFPREVILVHWAVYKDWNHAIYKNLPLDLNLNQKNLCDFNCVPILKDNIVYKLMTPTNLSILIYVCVCHLGHMTSDLAKQKLPIWANLDTSIFVETHAEYMNVCCLHKCTKIC